MQLLTHHHIAQVAVGLLVLGGLILPGILALATRGACSPLRAAAGFSRALTLAFGTSSSSAALPVRAACSFVPPAYQSGLSEADLEAGPGQSVADV